MWMQRLPDRLPGTDIGAMGITVQGGQKTTSENPFVTLFCCNIYSKTIILAKINRQTVIKPDELRA
jgi:hypothetical protein